MNRDSNYYLIEASKANKIYRDLKKKYEQLKSQGIDSIDTKRRAEFYKKKANQYTNLYRKKLVIEKRKKQENDSELREIQDKETNFNENQEFKKLEQEQLKDEQLKSEQQQKNLKQREEEYKLRTGKEYNPLVIDDENENDNNNNNNNNDNKNKDQKSLEQRSFVNKTNNPKIFTTSNSNIKKTKKRRQKLTKNEGIEMINLSKPQLGFSQTLKNKINKMTKNQSIDQEICKNIFVNGSNVNNKYFYPSEFPKLTKIKPITVSMKKGGKRNKKSCKRIHKK